MRYLFLFTDSAQCQDQQLRQNRDHITVLQRQSPSFQAGRSPPVLADVPVPPKVRVPSYTRLFSLLFFKYLLQLWDKVKRRLCMFPPPT